MANSAQAEVAKANPNKATATPTPSFSAKLVALAMAGENAALEKEITSHKANVQTLAEAGAVAHIAQVRHHGEQITLPVGMGIPDAILLLGRRMQYMDEVMEMRGTFDVFPWDGAHALDCVLSKKYGWTSAEPIVRETFFGKMVQKPKLISIEVAPGVHKTVPWGRFSLPGVDGFIQTFSDQKDGRVAFGLFAEVKRKDEETVRSIFNAIRAELKVNSIYRGQAIKIRFRDDGGDNLEMPTPKFMDTSRIDPDSLIYSDDVMNAIETNLFTPIKRVHELRANGIPVKRGVLLGGTYGTGKTLAATVAAVHAVESGITYVYVPRADELAQAIEFAKQYSDTACVVFCEDIDREADGERTVEMDDMLNLLDGIDTKDGNIMVVLTTNNMNALNPAILRPGRLDAVIDVTPPDAKAVQKLLRLYGGATISPDTALDKVGKALAGQIPAVIAEVVKRAKLAQLRLQPSGTRVTRITEAALLDATHTMQSQLKLLSDRMAEKVAPPTVDSLMRDIVGGGDMARQVKELHDRVV